MNKIIASLIILGLCVNVCLSANGVAPVSSSNSGAFSSSVLNSTATKIWSAANTTDAANWDSSSTTTTPAGVVASYVWFGPGASNGTSYVYGVASSGYTSSTSTGQSSAKTTQTIYQVTSIRKRTINNTIVGWGNDTTEASVISDTAITTAIMGQPNAAAVCPGYLAILTASFDSTSAATINQQIYVTLVSGSAGSASTTKITSNADLWDSATGVPSTSDKCTYTTVGVGNIWYDIGSGVFFFTYWKRVDTTTTATTAGTCPSSPTSAYTINLGGIYPNGTLYWTAPISAATVAANAVSNLVGGGDNWLNASNIYIMYKDATSSVLTTYYSKTTKSANTTAVGAFGSLVKDTTSGTSGAADYVIMTYAPASVWASNYTYGMTVTNTTGTGATVAYTYKYTNYLNGTTTGVDSGLTTTSAVSAGGYTGWMLTTGYSILATFATSTTSPVPTSYVFGTYYANGTVNTTAASIGSTTYAGAQFYEDLNGTMWIGWQDVDTASGNAVTPGGALSYAGYLAKFQGQLNVAGANALTTILAFVALFFAAIFAF